MVEKGIKTMTMKIIKRKKHVNCKHVAIWSSGQMYFSSALLEDNETPRFFVIGYDQEKGEIGLYFTNKNSDAARALTYIKNRTAAIGSLPGYLKRLLRNKIENTIFNSNNWFFVIPSFINNFN